jgi:4-diphosphocytidyl-2-C-methyl-D-erythritol kinase
MRLVKNSCTRVTLALDIVRRLADGPYAGYHELGTVKHRIDLSDTVTAEDAPADILECDDPAVPLDGSNVCLKAVSLVQKKYGIDRHVRIAIVKRIPVMGGLAGGSANAAATLSLLNALWELGLPDAELAALGRTIGMDVPYYFTGWTAFDAEAGLRLEPVATKCMFDFVLACPEFGVSTEEAYAGIDYRATGRNRGKTARLRGALESDDCDGAVSNIHNDFELSLFVRFPRLKEVWQELLGAGCRAAFLSGSGSTVVGVAQDRQHAEKVKEKISCRTIIASTLIV